MLTAAFNNVKKSLTALILLLGGLSTLAWGSEADLVMPNLSTQVFLGINGHSLLLWGMLICVFGMIFGLYQYMQINKLKAHASMREVSELIFATCKTYLIEQGKFILILEAIIGVVIVGYFGFLRHLEAIKVVAILASSLLGIAGSYFVAWFGMRINTLANSASAFASLEGKAFPVYAIPIKAGMSIGTLLVSIELFMMLCILLFIDPTFAGPCFIGFAIGESLGASVLRIAGGIFTKIADIGSDLMKVIFKIGEDDPRNPGTIADCVGDNAGDSVGPTADGFETYGVTGVALIAFLALALATNPAMGGKLIVWIFAMRILMILTSLASYFANDVVSKSLFD